jgi:hypothetical protein
MRHYAHLLDEDVEERGDAFNRSIFNEEEEGRIRLVSVLARRL